jgi:hypothetical protein
VSLATIQHPGNGKPEQSASHTGKISSLRDLLTGQIRMPPCSCMSRVARGSSRHVAVHPLGGPSRWITTEGALGHARQSHLSR